MKSDKIESQIQRLFRNPMLSCAFLAFMLITLQQSSVPQICGVQVKGVGRLFPDPKANYQTRIISSDKRLPTSSSIQSGIVRITNTDAQQDDDKLWDFDVALKEVNFTLEGDHNGANGENGIPDSVEMGLIASILDQPELDLSAVGGVRGTEVRAAWDQAHASASNDVAQHLKQWPKLPTLVTGYVLIGTTDSFNAINRLSTAYGAPLNGDYTLAGPLKKFLGPDGDADGDTFTNRQEYHAFGRTDRASFYQAALDPQQAPTLEQLADLPRPKKTRFKVGIVLYEGFEVLDVYGPLEMWGNVTEFEVFTVAENAGPIRSAQGVETVASYSFADAPPIDILMVPGGRGTIEQLKNTTMLKFLKKAHQTTDFTTSVCTGSALLAKAGILDGLRATTNKAFFSLSTRQSDQVQWVEKARWVEDGKVFTSSGVSAGTDMSLAVVSKILGADRAQELATQLEYQWQSDPNNDPFADRIRK
jgi:putative intracellular protease/amidase